jgi:hypothetical protein
MLPLQILFLQNWDAPQWIEIDAYQNWQTFVASVENILR